eukprot:TRINITY_DN76861_c0_g1_i1.p1 TRINITY_DN76861_c0_g1~~TRINITY_DN76861_c0_g1_i1.p1  ORF type:complete len:242 (-),score=46.86 TRINITY_DN76861_c0_g1_i1:114-812(-)
MGRRAPYLLALTLSLFGALQSVAFVNGWVRGVSESVRQGVQLQALKRLTKKEQRQRNVARSREIGMRQLSQKLVNKQVKRISKIAEDDAWVDEYLSFSRPTAVGGDYFLPEAEAKQVLDEIYGEGPDLENIDLDDFEDDEEDQSLSEEELQDLERIRRKPDPSRSPGSDRAKKTRVRWTNVPGVQKHVVAMPQEVATGGGSMGLQGGSVSSDFQDVWVSGASVRYDYEEKPL